MDQHVKALSDATKSGDVEETHKEAASVTFAAAQYLAIARKEAENTEDIAYRRELEVKIREVEMSKWV